MGTLTGGGLFPAAEIEMPRRKKKKGEVDKTGELRGMNVIPLYREPLGMRSLAHSAII